MKTLKEKAEQMGIELLPVKRSDGSIIDGQYDFQYKGKLCKTWINEEHHRCYKLKENAEDYYGTGLCCDSFDMFIDKFDVFVKYLKEKHGIE